MSVPPGPPDPPDPPDPPETELEPGRINRPARHEPPITEWEPDREPRRSAGNDELPPPLAERFQIVERMPTPNSGQADLYLVQEGMAEGPRQVLKVYRSKVVPDSAVWAALTGRHVGRELVFIAETGRADGRHYELMEHLSGGDISKLRDGSGGAPGPEVLREVARRLANALTLLHDLGIAHRDVKPGNVLLRSLPGEPPDLALIDFGISRWMDDSDILRTLSGTVAYSAPEALMGRPTTGSDWWSLGVVLYELATGTLPYDVRDPDVIRQQAAAGRPIDFTEIADPALRLLCRALLQRDPRDRWGSGEIQLWLAGEPPALPEPEPEAEPRPEPAAWPLPAFGEEAVDPRGLAEILEQRWERAAERYFAQPPGAAWWQLREWLKQFDDPDHYDLPGRKKLLQRAETTRRREPSHVLLLRLLLWLDPDRVPSYRRELITPQTLVDLAQRAITQEAGVGDVIADLRRYDLLPLLATAEGNSALGEIAHRWRDLGKDWDKTPRTLAKQGIGLESADTARVGPFLLWLAISPASLHVWLDQQTTRIRGLLAAEVPWFSALLASDHDLDRLRAVLLEARARSQANEIEAEQRKEGALLSWERRRDEKIRWHRDQQRLLAAGWAAAGGAVAVIFWCWVIRLSDTIPLASLDTIEMAWACAVLFMVVVLAGELSLAVVMGGLYYQYRHYALLGTLVRHGRRVLHPFRDNGWLALPFIIGFAALLVASTTYAPYALPLVCGIAHLQWTVSRHLRWQREWNALTPPAAQPDPADSADPATEAS